MNKKLTLRSIITLLLAMATASACLFGCAQAPSMEEGASNSPSAATSTAAANEMVVAVEIDPTAADGKVDLPVDDLAITSQDVTLADGATAYDALVATGAVLEGSETYVTSVNGLAEKAAGPTYGWMYEVNSETPSVAANECTLQPGDSVRWYYDSWGE